MGDRVITDNGPVEIVSTGPLSYYSVMLLDASEFFAHLGEGGNHLVVDGFWCGVMLLFEGFGGLGCEGCIGVGTRGGGCVCLCFGQIMVFLGKDMVIFV